MKAIFSNSRKQISMLLHLMVLPLHKIVLGRVAKGFGNNCAV
jgi:hypothetical protein